MGLLKNEHGVYVVRKKVPAHLRGLWPLYSARTIQRGWLSQHSMLILQAAHAYARRHGL